VPVRVLGAPSPATWSLLSRRRARAGPRPGVGALVRAGLTDEGGIGSVLPRRHHLPRRPHGRGQAGRTPPRPSSAPSGRSPAGAAPHAPHAPPSARSSL